MPKIHEANSNGTLQVTLPKKTAEALGWVSGDELNTLLLYRDHTKKEVIGIGFKLKEGQNNRRNLVRDDNEATAVRDVKTGEQMFLDND